jgi:hypothetical protein
MELVVAILVPISSLTQSINGRKDGKLLVNTSVDRDG